MSNHTPATCTSAPAAAPRWVKSSFSFANGDCVEVASLPGGGIGVRDSKHTSGPVLEFTRSEWRAFADGVQRGKFG